MVDGTIKIPGPDHSITIERNPSRVVVTFGGNVIADTTSALTLREAKYPPVQYIPRKDVDMAALKRSDTASYCPLAFPRAVSVRWTRSGTYEAWLFFNAAYCISRIGVLPIRLRPV